MKDDFKNIIITFGLIAFAFMQGFNTYHNKLQSDAFVISQKQNIKKTYNKPIVINGNDVFYNQATKGISNISTNTISNQASSEILAKQQEQILLDKQTAIIAPSKKQPQVAQQAKPQSKIQSITSSRQSSAS